MINCSACGRKISEENTVCPICGEATGGSATVRDQPNSEKSTRRGGSPWVIRGFAVVAGLVGIIVFTHFLTRDYHSVIGDQPDVPWQVTPLSGEVASSMVVAVMKNGSITIPLAALQQRRLVRFVDPEGIQSIPVIAYVENGGKLVTAMSVSEKCGSTDFFLKGENIHCAACPSHWDMKNMKAMACCPNYYPDPIPSSIVGNDVVIQPDVVRKRSSRL